MLVKLFIMFYMSKINKLKFLAISNFKVNKTVVYIYHSQIFLSIINFLILYKADKTY